MFLDSALNYTGHYWMYPETPPFHFVLKIGNQFFLSNQICYCSRHILYFFYSTLRFLICSNAKAPKASAVGEIESSTDIQNDKIMKITRQLMWNVILYRLYSILSFLFVLCVFAVYRMFALQWYMSKRKCRMPILYYAQTENYNSTSGYDESAILIAFTTNGWEVC